MITVAGNYSHSTHVSQLGSPWLSSMRTNISEADVVVWCTLLEGEAIGLGHFQRLYSTLNVDVVNQQNISIFRRTTGGPALQMGSGQIYVAIELRTPELLGGTPLINRALNRHIRPLLLALSVGGTLAMYGGRDFIMVNGHPVAWVGIRHQKSTRHIGLEAIISLEKNFFLDPKFDLAKDEIKPRFLGKTPQVLFNCYRASMNPHSMLERIVDAYQQKGDRTLSFHAPESIPNDVERFHENQPAFTALVEESIGLIGACIDHNIVSVGGDWLVSEDVNDELNLALTELGPDATLHQRTNIIHNILFQPDVLCMGVRSAESIAKAVTAAWAYA